MVVSQKFSSNSLRGPNSLSPLEQVLEFRWGQRQNKWSTAEFLCCLDEFTQLRKWILRAHPSDVTNENNEQESIMFLLSQSGPSQICDETLRLLVEKEACSLTPQSQGVHRLEILQMAAVCRYFALHLGLDPHLLQAAGLLTKVHTGKACNRRYPPMIAIVLMSLDQPDRLDQEGVEIEAIVHIIHLAQALSSALKGRHPLTEISKLLALKSANYLGLTAEHLKIILAALLTYSAESELIGEAFCSFIQEKSDLPQLLVKRSWALLAEQNSSESGCLSSYATRILSTPPTSLPPLIEQKAKEEEEKLELEPLSKRPQLKKAQDSSTNRNAALPKSEEHSALSIRLPALLSDKNLSKSELHTSTSAPSTLRQNSNHSKKSATCSSARVLPLSYDHAAQVFALPYQTKAEKCAVCSNQSEVKVCPVCGSNYCPTHFDRKNYWCSLCDQEYQRLRRALRPPLELMVVAIVSSLILMSAGFYLAQQEGLLIALSAIIILFTLGSLSLRGLTKMQTRTQRSRLFHKNNQVPKAQSSFVGAHSSLSPAVRPLSVTPMVQADLDAEARRAETDERKSQGAKSAEEAPPNTIASADDFRKALSSRRNTLKHFPGPSFYDDAGNTQAIPLSRSTEFGTSPPPSASFVDIGATSKRTI